MNRLTRVIEHVLLWEANSELSVIEMSESARSSLASSMFIPAHANYRGGLGMRLDPHRICLTSGSNVIWGGTKQI